MNLPINIEEEEIDDGFGVQLSKRRLYHGSATTNIEEMQSAYETTVGEGLYLTNTNQDAAAYALRRARNRAHMSNEAAPTVYEMEIESARLLDLTKPDNVRRVASGFADVLRQLKNDPNIPVTWPELIDRILVQIRLDKITPGSVRNLAFSFSPQFTTYVSGLGYEGLKTFEGGEGDDIGNHLTYLLFDPNQAKVINERLVTDN